MSNGRPPHNLCFQTRRGRMFHGAAEDVLAQEQIQRLKGSVQLIFTSPPFPLQRKKRYGNKTGSEYINWLASFASRFSELLTPDGSIVVEIGNAWQPRSPTMSTLPMRALLEFQEAGNLHLCQEFVWNNPAKLPTPAQWVTVERIRVKDSFTRLWWLSPSDRPKACNRRVLQPYSEKMRELLDRGKYNAGRRPSEHNISETSFLQDNSGAIPSNVLSHSNTSATDSYRRYCVDIGAEVHPARMPVGVAEFFIQFLTEEDDLVLDPFAGSNTTGYAAERNDRNWIGIEPQVEYLRGALGRFMDADKLSVPSKGPLGPNGRARNRGKDPA